MAASRVTGLATFKHMKLPYRRWGISPRPEVWYCVEITLLASALQRGGQKKGDERRSRQGMMITCRSIP